MPKVGIIVLNFNTYDETKKCIESIKSVTKCEYKIYVVDNASTIQCKEELKRTYLDDDLVELIMLKENLGYSRGNNKGILCAIKEDIDYVAIVNSDIVFKNDVLSILMEDLSQDVPFAGPKVINLLGMDAQQLTKTYTYISALLDRMPFAYLKRIFGIGFIDSRKIKSKINFYGMVSGCCFLARVNEFKKLNFLDENTFLYSEERILSIKMKENGMMACYDPRACVIHMEGGTTSKSGSAFSDYHRYASDYYVIKRYIHSTSFKLMMIKILRIINYRLKSFVRKEYRSYYKRLLSKMIQIEKEQYRIER